MKPIDIHDLANKFKAGNCTPEELDALENWYLQWQPEEVDLSAEQLETLMKVVWTSMPAAETTKPKSVKLWPSRWIKIAAAVVMVASAAAVYLYHHPVRFADPQANYVIDIPPPVSQATLTLSNGKHIHLSGRGIGQLARQAGITITKTTGGQITYKIMPGQTSDIGSKAPVQYNTLTTPHGSAYTLILSDGTQVVMNAVSSLKFPATFSNLKERRVELTGEAYFTVKHSNKQPFRVYTANQLVEDLGTEFNLNAYTDEGEVKTTLVTGSARVSGYQAEGRPGSLYRPLPGSRTRDNEVVLQPNQQSTLQGGAFQVRTIDPQLAIAWKNGLFYYKNTPMETVMRQISRWYNVDIEYQDPGIQKQTFSGSVSRYDNLSKLLKAIEFIEAARFKKEGRKIIVMKYE